MRIAVAMSGGVDSSVVAHLLKEQGHDLVGFFMRNGVKAESEGAKKSCCSASDARDASIVADQLGIPFYSLNIADGFSKLLDYFADEYMAGRTPSPCVHCNGWLKFGALVQSARECGAEAVATGHYARVDRVEHESASGSPRFRLRRALDRDKDQSYFLFSLTQEQLAWTRFPLGEMTKDQVRAVARRADLIVQDKPESQEICFAPAGNYGAVVERVSGVAATPGPIVDEEGRQLGTHRGTIHYTIGQRRGLGVALGEPHYVVSISPETNTVVLGKDESLRESRAEVRDTNWIVPEPRDGESLRAEVRIRYRHAPSPATIIRHGDRVSVRFDEPQRAITPGQAAVFSRGDEILGGGWLEGALASSMKDRSPSGRSANERGVKDRTGSAPDPFRDLPSGSFPV